MNILQALSGSVSAFWVGRYLGEAALTAITNAQSFMFLLTGAAFGVAAGATVLVGQYVGAGKTDEVKKVVITGGVLYLALSVALTIGGVVLAESILIAMRTGGESLALAVSYTRVMFLALPIISLYLYVILILLGAGDARTPLWSIVLGVGLSAVLNPVFIFGIGVFPGVGIAGAALATLVAQAASLIVLVRRMYRDLNPLCLYRHDIARLRVDWAIAGKLLRMGIPMGAQILVISSSAVVMITLVNRFGVDTTAAYGASLQLWTYIQFPAIAVATAVSSMAAQSVGAQNWDRVRKTAQVGVTWCAVITGAMILLVYTADEYAYGLFLPKGSSALHIASRLNLIVMWSLVFLVIALVLFAVMRGTGVVIAPLLTHVMSLFAVRFPLALFLMGEWQADAIWFSLSVSHVVDLLLAALYYRYGGWQRGDRVRPDMPLGGVSTKTLSTPRVDC
jgi:putative MATE family efflux protein